MYRIFQLYAFNLLNIDKFCQNILVRYNFSKTRIEVVYLLGQKFLKPYPKELALRSDIKGVK